MKGICDFCYRKYPLNPKAPNQKYCTRQDCRQERHRIGQQKKKATDKDYREKQAKLNEKWLEKRPTYWKEYRAKHKEYTEKNREQQKKRNEKRKRLLNLPDFVKDEIAKMENTNKKNTLITGYYKLIPLRSNKIAKMEEIIVKIEIFSRT